MNTIETYMLHGIVARLVDAIPANRAEALILAGWLGGRPEIFGPLPPISPVGRHKPGVEAQDWRALAAHLQTRLQHTVVPDDQPLARLRVIAEHLGLGPSETVILSHLALQQRGRMIADFTAVLRRETGLSDEAALAWCCNLDEADVWAALAPQAALVAQGLVQTDAGQPVLRDDPYTLSGLFLALLRPSARKTSALIR
ncbi:hypothetical protein [Paracoccus sp. IB05]|uniref:hypothetical protein n=1 Tax=Paracoccus sp. IB05 TaxID=2779367 RepID=UPI0018E88888|nr:hypothetical protein [Paracoccus sp. IB05]MBJ2152660.1 hypothetical protein [Paracoccus sp. IB05]